MREEQQISKRSRVYEEQGKVTIYFTADDGSEYHISYEGIMTNQIVALVNHGGLTLSFKAPPEPSDGLCCDITAGLVAGINSDFPPPLEGLERLKRIWGNRWWKFRTYVTKPIYGQPWMKGNREFRKAKREILGH